ncbi:uncharacterized protein CEXT_507631 [Caerostris extrusa]|uniref:Uncharacterized protein n=1 Tax=Caerostris extrusa TaxID=172846 RepID=A0AAV4TPE7_CAEEX|nr:uncharacterized protein CEXT_507631 [Caerostris extrusa]
MAFSVSMEMREQQERLKSSQTKHLNSSRLPPSRDFLGYRMGCRVAPHQLSPGWNMVAASKAIAKDKLFPVSHLTSYRDTGTHLECKNTTQLSSYTKHAFV